MRNLKIFEAMQIVRDELMKRGDLYNAFAASIESSIKEQDLRGLPFHPTRDIAERILDRVIGEEEKIDEKTEKKRCEE